MLDHFQCMKMNLLLSLFIMIMMISIKYSNIHNKNNVFFIFNLITFLFIVLFLNKIAW